MTVTHENGRTFDRVPEFDERSCGFNIKDRLDGIAEPRSYTWGCKVNLDQGPDGACVGFGWTQERAAKPRPDLSVTYETAMTLYREAQKNDEWPGENYEGTSVLAGAKVATARGWIGEYRWAFNTDDALVAISRKGPAVIGINWYAGMFDPDDKGFLHVTGKVAGGHCILVRGVNVKQEFVVLHNSWGAGWGGTKYGPGTALLSFADFDRLLTEQGDCCIPVVRNK